ncbi:MAG: hypothetical protein F6J93_05785 [Oscillatoria sp. SIO1A7]|nr:hypothetical protein [Oscillatoria sp. SIO1A7]
MRISHYNAQCPGNALVIAAEFPMPNFIPRQVLGVARPPGRRDPITKKALLLCCSVPLADC